MRWGVGFSILYPSSDLNIMYVGYSAAGPERWIRGGGVGGWSAATVTVGAAADGHRLRTVQ
jgi:hypothetical protein